MSGPPGVPHPHSGGARTVDPSVFRLLVDSEMRKAQRLRYCVSVVCVCAKAAAAELTAGRFLDLFQSKLRATDVVTLWPPDSLSVLLVDAESGDIPAVMRRVTSDLAEGSWGAGAVSYPKAQPIAEDMLRQAAKLMERASLDPAKSLYLA